MYDQYLKELEELRGYDDGEFQVWPEANAALKAAIALMKERAEFIKANSDLIGDGRFQLRPNDIDLVNKVMIIRQSAARRSK